MHIKRNNIPKTWPLTRKQGTKYLAVSDHSGKIGLPLLFVMREILGIVKTRKEAKKIILNKEIKVNGVIVKSEMLPVQIFDKISIDKIKKYYSLNIVNKKFKVEEISEKDSHKKTVKISGKKIIGTDKIQINFEDGQNILYKYEFSVGDSAVLNFEKEKNSVEKILKLEKGANVEVISGKHAGKRGKLEEVVKLGLGKKFKIKLESGVVELPLKTILVVE